MKRINILHFIHDHQRLMILSAVICVFLFAVIRVCAEEKLNLAVAEFEARNVSQMDAVTLSDLFRTELVQINAFHLLDRKNMESILGEHSFQFSGCNNQSCAVELGKLLNANKVVIGSFSKLFADYYINISLVDVETAEIIYADVARIMDYREMKKIIEEMAMKLSGKFGKSGILEEEKITFGSGRIPCVSGIIKDGKTVKINRGSYDAIKENDLFNLYRVDKIVGQLQVTEVKDDESIAKIINLTEGYKVVPGVIVKYTGRFRKHGFGFMIGINGGETFSHNAPGLGFYYDFVSKSGLGLQLTAAIWPNSENSEGLQGEESITVNYIYPLLLRLHKDILSPVSPFIGIGISYARFWWDRWPRTGLIHEEDSTDTFVPVLNAGLKFFSTNPVQFTLDYRYFLGGKYHGWNTNLQSIMGGISTHW